MSEKTLHDFIKEVMDKKQPKGWLGVEKEDIIDAAILYASYREQQASAKVFEIYHPKVKAFADRMQIEIHANAEKGDWEEWQNIPQILLDFEEHKAKLWLELKAGNNRERIKELIADCANLLLYLGNCHDLYS